MTPSIGRRRGTTLVEAAIILPVTLLLIIGLIVGGLGVFRYQQTAALAREASRWAAVHGAQYARETGEPAATADDIHRQVVLARAAGLDPRRLNSTVTWNTSNEPFTLISDNGATVNNTVTVTVTYDWLPEFFLIGVHRLSSSSTVPMAY